MPVCIRSGLLEAFVLQNFAVAVSFPPPVDYYSRVNKTRVVSQSIKAELAMSGTEIPNSGFTRAACDLRC
jgi:hypothetical protein